MKRGFCPVCETENEILLVKRNVEISVKGEVFTVPEAVHRCTACLEEFTCSGDDSDPVAEAFTMFREKHGFSPAEG